MTKVIILLADGFEEAEALVPADLLIRAGATVLLTSADGQETVTGSHGFRIAADCPLTGLDVSDAQCLFLPGGKAGTERLGSNPSVLQAIRTAFENGILIASICAAPSILGKNGYLNGRKYVCYPGFESQITGGIRSGGKTELDDIFLTGEGMGVAQEFGLRMVRLLFGEEAETELREKIRA